MRDMKTVVDRMLEQVPEDYEARDELKRRCDSIVESSSFAAPEMQQHWWSDLQLALIETLGQADTEWKIKITKIFAGRE